MIDGNRIRQIRKLKRWTQKDLAGLIEVKQSAVSQLEGGQIQPSPEVLAALHRASGFPEEFFELAGESAFPLGSLSFRARRSASKVDIEEAHVWAEFLFEWASSLAGKIGLMPPSLPDLTSEEPAVAARIARSLFDLPPAEPIINVVNTLERKFLMILAVPAVLPGRDAFSAWAGSNRPFPVIVLPTGGLGGRRRFTVAHELHHLLTRSFRGYAAVAERTADEFAAEFMLPASSMRLELKSPLTIARLAPIGRRWGASLQALVRRAADLKVISSRRYQQLNIELSQAGLARDEHPLALVRLEKPRLFKRMAEEIYGEPVDVSRLARDCAIPENLAKAVLDAHASRDEITSSIS